MKRTSKRELKSDDVDPKLNKIIALVFSKKNLVTDWNEDAEMVTNILQQEADFRV